jgi:FkbM family methyltransferase
MSRTIARSLAALARGATAVMKPYRRRITRALLCENMAQQLEVPAGNGTLRFDITTARSLHDVLTLGAGEPQTVAWLDGFSSGTLWDIGANIGLYSLYAACVRGLDVVAFEPSASSFAALAKNIEINNASDRIAPFCMALGETTKRDDLWMASTEAGHSMHRIGESGGRAYHQAIPVYEGDEFRRLFGLPQPRYLKSDVDGPELTVLRGLSVTLAEVQSIIIEAETEEMERAIDQLLLPMGFHRNEALADNRSRNIVFDR